MNYYLDQQMPTGLVYRTNVLNLEECAKLMLILNSLKYNDKDVPEINYGYYYEKRHIKLDKKIPKYLSKYLGSIVSRMGIDMSRVNNVCIRDCSNYKFISPKVEPLRNGEKLLMVIVGCPVQFKMVNTHQARAQFNTYFNNGSCLLLEDESRLSWTHQTVPNYGKRWIITYRHVDKSYDDDFNKEELKSKLK